ncbi:MAG: methionyl-tRNA formyltransferase, partial [Cyanobacteria bacterium REEB65]|nr:methionyl-tRNA formyltransferase [Cyanobacteria bacterium REEB65]
MIRYAFFGSSRFSLLVLEELVRAGSPPAVVVTAPDKPVGRSLEISPTPLKAWAEASRTRADGPLPVLEPAKLDPVFAQAIRRQACDLFLVASYGKIIPSHILDMPAHKCLNVHPSLLPRYR